MNVGNESHNDTSGDRGLGTYKKGMNKWIKKIPGGIRIQELQKITLSSDKQNGRQKLNKDWISLSKFQYNYLI